MRADGASRKSSTRTCHSDNDLVLLRFRTSIVQVMHTEADSDLLGKVIGLSVSNGCGRCKYTLVGCNPYVARYPSNDWRRMKRSAVAGFHADIHFVVRLSE